MNAPEGCFNLKVTVSASGMVTLSTMLNWAWRALETPFGGKTMREKLACTSAAVTGVPSWNFASLRILKA